MEGIDSGGRPGSYGEFWRRQRNPCYTCNNLTTRTWTWLLFLEKGTRLRSREQVAYCFPDFRMVWKYDYNTVNKFVYANVLLQVGRVKMLWVTYELLYCCRCYPPSVTGYAVKGTLHAGRRYCRILYRWKYKNLYMVKQSIHRRGILHHDDFRP